MYKELPPAWSGNDAEKTFRKWIIELDHWERMTSYPEIARGYLVRKSLPKSVQEQLSHLERNGVLHRNDSLSKIKSILLENYAYVGKCEDQEDFEKAKQDLVVAIDKKGERISAAVLVERERRTGVQL